MGIHGRRLAVGLCAVAALAGCSGGAQAPASRIPEFARPGLLAYDDASAGDWIRYRELTRDDFRASEPPDPLGHGAGQIGAATCASIRARPDARISVQRSDEGVVVVPEGLVFEAFLDRDCSWWNDANTALPPEYVLEHEQIHFALFELEARSLTGRASSAARVTAEAGAKPEALARQVQERVDAELERAAQAVLQRSLAFDEDTSFAFVPDVQARWRERVERELAESR